MSVEVITTSLTLAETVPALAPQLDRARAELATAREAAITAARRLAPTQPSWPHPAELAPPSLIGPAHRPPSHM